MSGMMTPSSSESVQDSQRGPLSGPVQRMSWDEYGSKMAKTASERSTCTRRQVGAILMETSTRNIIITGYNGAPPGEAHCIDGHCPRGLLSYEQLAEYSDYKSGPGRCVAIHAEVNAIRRANLRAVPYTLYVTDEPCKDCWTVVRSVPNIHRVVWPTGEWNK